MDTNTQIVTRKITIKPAFSPRKEWVKRVKEFTIKELENRIQKYKEWISNLGSSSKLKKDEKERRRQKYTMLLDNAQVELDQFQENSEITQRMVDRYTRNLVKEAMESEARRKNYILSWAFYTMIANGVEYMEFPEQKKFIRKMMNPAYRIKGSSKGSIFDDVEIDNILGGYGIGFNQELTGVVIDYVQKGMFI